MRFLPILFLFLSTPVFAALNDTGQNLCYEGIWLLATCDAANTGDGSPYPRQDGRFGRDAQAAAGLLTKAGAGTAGFDYTRICMSGQAAGTGTCPANPSPGTEPNDWACTRDNVTGLVWSITTIGPGDWATANTYPASYNGTSRCGFNSDWRVPHTRELLSIVHHGVTDPAIDVAFFPDTLSNWYWSSDDYVPIADSVWLVNFFNGSDQPGSTNGNGSVRLVHGAPIPDGDYTVNGDATVLDDSTSLIWDRCSWGQSGSDCADGSASLHTWTEALAVAVTANAMNYKGYNDWRLPNRTELESLLAISTPALAIDSVTFPNMPTTPYFWSSTTYAYSQANEAWYVDFVHFAGEPTSPKNDALRVRLVRGGQSFDVLASGAAHVPTLSEWGMILLGLLMTGFAAFSLRRNVRSVSSTASHGRDGMP